MYGDARLVEKSFRKFSVHDVRRLIDPTMNKVNKVRTSIRKQIQVHPDKKFLVIYVFACHGMQMDGRQVAVVNSFNKKITSYHLWGAEADIRERASKNKNAYLLGIFACCREIFNSQTHRGYFGGSLLQAYLQYDKQTFEEARANAEAATNAELRLKIQQLQAEVSQFKNIEKMRIAGK